MLMTKTLSCLALSLSMTCAMADTGLKSLENISQELVEIRDRIERLHSEISYEKDAFKDQMRSYVNQKSDLDVRISRSELNIKDLERELKQLSEANSKKSLVHENIAPVVNDAIQYLKESVSQSLPFKLNERLKALEEIKFRLDTHVITPNKAANQLWAFVEDELMLGRSSGIYNDTLNIDGQDKLVKVLRIGKIAMFYKTPDGKFGLLHKKGQQWQMQSLKDPDSVAQLERLFDSFTKNIRNGQFTTPNFLPRS